MSRLLFAAARGARTEQKLHHNKWTPGIDLGLQRWHPALCRVHPKDAHLQYGPISTALRDALEDPDCVIDPLIEVLANATYEHFHGWDPLGEHCDVELHRSLFLLILA